MWRSRIVPKLSLLCLAAVAARPAAAAPEDAPPPASAPAARPGKLAHVDVDVAHQRVRVECEALNCHMPLEFFCVRTGTNEHESVLRTAAKASDVHFALLMLGLTPGEPARYDEARKQWRPPHGPPLEIACEFADAAGRRRVVPAAEMVRSVKTHEPMRSAVWVFDGSRVMPDGVYAADVTGYVVSVVNFDLTTIDVPALASNSNDTLQWEWNPEVVPKTGTPVTMVISPATPAAAAEAEREEQKTQGPDFNPGPGGGGAGGDVPTTAPATRP